jgi:outer membrane protein assembly factor BamB
VYGGAVYFGTSDSKLFHALDINTGKPKFSLPTRVNTFSSAAIAGGMAYFGTSDGKLHAVDIKSGKYAWEFVTDAARQNVLGLLMPNGEMNLPALYRSDFYEDMVLALDRLMSLGAILSSPVVDRGVIYFGSADGNLYAIE